MHPTSTERSQHILSESPVFRAKPFYWPPLKQSLRKSALSYLTLTKPGITLSVLITTIAGFILGSTYTGTFGGVNWPLLLHTLLGTALVSSGASALNMLLEMESDSVMDRTKNRPLPMGQIQPEQAFLFGTLIASIGIVHIAAMSNLSACFIAATALTLYLVFYTPMKKTTYGCIVVGAVSGALPPLIGWAAATKSFGLGSLEGWSLFLILFIWQFPHLLALSYLYRNDYARAEFKIFPTGDQMSLITAKIATIFSLLLLPTSLIPYWIKLSGIFYFYCAIILGTVFIGTSFYFLIQKTDRTAKILFITSIFYLPLLLLSMVIG